MLDSLNSTKTWPELAVGLYDQITEWGAAIIYEAENFEMRVPSKAGENAEHARWILNGMLKLRTPNRAAGQS